MPAINAAPEVDVGADPHSGGSPRRMFRVWRGLGLAECLRLLALRPPLDVASIPLIASLLCTSSLNSILAGVERLFWGGRIHRHEPHESPLFILGHWRSGTTLLHHLLALDSRFAFVNLYQSLFPGHFLLSERWITRLTRGLIPEKRPVDEVPLAWDLPQEDETALLLLTLRSPYLWLAFPNDPGKAERLASAATRPGGREAELWKGAFLRLLKKVSLAGGNRPLLLKSPTHTSRIPLLLELFPKARFVYVVRDPYAVYASTLKLRRSMYEANRLSRAEPVNLEEQVLDGYMKMYQSYHMHRVLIDPARLCELRYEDLVADPAGTLESLYQKLGLAGFEEIRPAITARLEEHRRYRTSTPAIGRDEMLGVYERWRPAFRRYGYPSRLAPDEREIGAGEPTATP